MEKVQKPTTEKKSKTETKTESKTTQAKSQKKETPEKPAKKKQPEPKQKKVEQTKTEQPKAEQKKVEPQKTPKTSVEEKSSPEKEKKKKKNLLIILLVSLGVVCVVLASIILSSQKTKITPEIPPSVKLCITPQTLTTHGTSTNLAEYEELDLLKQDETSAEATYPVVEAKISDTETLVYRYTITNDNKDDILYNLEFDCTTKINCTIQYGINHSSPTDYIEPISGTLESHLSIIIYIYISVTDIDYDAELDGTLIFTVTLLGA